MERELTVIIPFVNEGIEVEKTIESIYKYSNNDVDVIVINDASDDNYDYENRLRKYPIRYILNSTRIGVAASRDKGVLLCKTKYFLLLDAHMRFYNSDWVDEITNELRHDEKLLLCTQTKVLKKENGIVFESGDSENSENYWGGYVNFYSPCDFLEAQWAYSDWILQTNRKALTKLIPCVLGAGYASSKQYWQQIHGLKGLLSYGNDEVLMSMKVWLTGGKCKLIPQIVIGHIYRNASPYKHFTDRRIYNRIYISWLLCPTFIQRKLLSIEKVKYPDDFFKAIILLYKNFDSITEEIRSFKSVSNECFSSFERFNRSRKFVEKETEETKNKYLQKSILCILRHYNSLPNSGLITGKMGIVILLFHYAKFENNKYITHLAKSFLYEIVDNLNSCDSLSFSEGLIGVGWGICYLLQHHFISCDVSDFLADIDNRIMDFSPSSMSNLDIEFGLGGIIRYVLTRLYGRDEPLGSIFSLSFLAELYERAKSVLDEEIYNFCPEVYFEYIAYYENKTKVTKASIYDIVALPSWNKYSKSVKDITMYGLSGMCMDYLLSKYHNI